MKLKDIILIAMIVSIMVFSFILAIRTEKNYAEIIKINERIILLLDENNLEQKAILDSIKIEQIEMRKYFEE